MLGGSGPQPPQRLEELSLIMPEKKTPFFRK